jgi:hypothetical protein
VTIPVHPTDTLAVSVQYQNAAHHAVAGTVPTSWTATDPDGTTPFTGVNFAVAAFPDDETATATLSVDDGNFVIHAQLQGASFEAVSEDIDISPDNTPTSGVVNITVSPAA